MFDDLIDSEVIEESILVKRSEYEALKDNVGTKQKLIESMVTDIVALRLKIRNLESVLDSLNYDGTVV